VLVSVVAFVFVLGVLIFVHELGHFLAAKAVGIGVPRFSIGFGPATPLRFQRGETEYVVAWFPLGGYVKMASREEQEAMASLEGGPTEPEFPAERLFESKPLWARIVVISAGVFMNFVFGWFVNATLAGLYGSTEDPTTTIAAVDSTTLPPAARHLADIPSGAQILRINGDTMRSYDAIVAAILDPGSQRLRIDVAGQAEPVLVPIRGTDTQDRQAVLGSLYPQWGPGVGEAVPGRPAARAGIEAGDRFIAVAGDTVRTYYDLFKAVNANPGVALPMTLERGDSVFTVSVTPAEETVTNPATGEEETVGRIGVNPAIEPLRIRYGAAGAVVEGWHRTWRAADLVWVTLKGIVLRQISAKEIGGPIFIGQMSGQLARIGLSALFEFMALLSVNLAILNLLPIPVLDGGHLVFLLIEGVRGRPLSVQARMRLTQAGLFILFGLMALVFTNDILRIFGR